MPKFKFKLPLKGVIKLKLETEVKERFFDSPHHTPNAELLLYLDEYIVRHYTVALPFKGATDHAKYEYENNHQRCNELKSFILKFGFNEFAMLRHGYVCAVTIEPEHEDKYERLRIKWFNLIK